MEITLQTFIKGSDQFVTLRVLECAFLLTFKVNTHCYLDGCQKNGWWKRLIERDLRKVYMGMMQWEWLIFRTIASKVRRMHRIRFLTLAYAKNYAGNYK